MQMWLTVCICVVTCLINMFVAKQCEKICLYFHNGIHIETKNISCIFMCIRFRCIYDIHMFDVQVWCVCVWILAKLGKFRFLQNSFHILQKYYVFCFTFDEVTVRVTEQTCTVYLLVWLNCDSYNAWYPGISLFDACLLMVPPTWLCQVLKCLATSVLQWSFLDIPRAFKHV